VTSVRLEPAVVLDARSSIGFDVALVWDPAANHVWVDVLHVGSSERFILPTTFERARRDFHHPFAALLP
jgi:hypothetical protein